MKEICNSDSCTGCSACADICPKGSIVMKPDKMGALLPVIDETSCIECGSCQKVCPSRSSGDLNPRAELVFAAWSKNEASRNSSASGGIASEIYRFCLANGFYSFGVTYERDKGAHYIEVKTEDDINRVKNSKYVYSNAAGVYKQINKLLIEGKKVLFIGLPCQVAALRRIIGKKDLNFYSIDLICHGVAPTTYLQQHVEFLEKTRHKKADALSFRDPLFYTNTFTFTLKNNGKVFYKNKAKSLDVYQLGYHRALIYRENCYHCRFACSERVGDITIGDYSGLGRMGIFKYERHNVSGFLCNTNKGIQLMQLLQQQCVFIQRPVEEIFKYEKQLQQPSIPHINRQVFLAKYNETGLFETSARNALRKDLFDVILHKGEWKSIFKKNILRLIPQRVLDYRKK